MAALRTASRSGLKDLNSGAATHSFAARLREAVDIQAGADGWTSGCGRPHPIGGYEAVSVTIQGDAGALWTPVMLDYSTDGTAHRTDGPATVVYEPWTGRRRQQWLARGQFHRLDGPAQCVQHASNAAHPELERSDFYAVGGVNLSTPGNDPNVGLGLGLERVRSRLKTFRAWGASREDAVGWLYYERRAGRGDVKPLIRSGVSGADAYACAAAGVLEPALVRQVAGGALPMSWATAGL